MNVACLQFEHLIVELATDNCRSPQRVIHHWRWPARKHQRVTWLVAAGRTQLAKNSFVVRTPLLHAEARRGRKGKPAGGVDCAPLLKDFASCAHR